MWTKFRHVLIHTMATPAELVGVCPVCHAASSGRSGSGACAMQVTPVPVHSECLKLWGCRRAAVGEKQPVVWKRKEKTSQSRTRPCLHLLSKMRDKLITEEERALSEATGVA